MAGAKDVQRLWQAYGDAVRREVESILEQIPSSNLAIQWDACAETLGHDPGAAAHWRWQPEGDPPERFSRSISNLSACIPESVVLGVHLCYGSFLEEHMIEPSDLGVCVELANTAARHAGRRLDYVHMPVPRERNDDDYFRPLGDLDIGRGRLYLGLIHAGSPDENLRRLDAARRHATGFGVGAECGFGRASPDAVPALVEAHRAVAEALG